MLRVEFPSGPSALGPVSVDSDATLVDLDATMVEGTWKAPSPARGAPPAN